MGEGKAGGELAQRLPQEALGFSVRLTTGARVLAAQAASYTTHHTQQTRRSPYHKNSVRVRKTHKPVVVGRLPFYM